MVAIVLQDAVCLVVAAVLTEEIWTTTTRLIAFNCFCDVSYCGLVQLVADTLKAY